MKIIQAVILIGIIAIISLSFRDKYTLVDHPIIEDAFYSCTIAKNIATGKGITSDGINITNGFQPLFTFITVPMFMISSGDDYHALRYINILSILLFIMSSLLFGLLMRDIYPSKTDEEKDSAFWLSFGAYLFSMLFLIEYLNGLETGFLLFCILLVLRIYQKVNTGTIKGIIILGIALGMTVLARIDMVFLVIGTAITIFMRKGNLRYKKKVKLILMLSLISFIISSPWWFYNLFYFHSLMPTSGQAQLSLAVNYNRIINILNSIIQNLVPYSYTFDRVLQTIPSIFIRGSFAIFLFMVIVKSSVVSRKSSEKYNKIFKLKEVITILSVSSSLLVLWYLLFSNAVHFYQRYLCIISLLGLIGFSIIMIYFYSRRIWAIRLCLTILMSYQICIVYLLQSQKLMHKNPYLHQQLELIKRNVPSNEYVAAGQSGTIGFFRSRVLNLDGKVNPEALIYSKNIVDYLEIKKVHWFCDWKDFVPIYLSKNPSKCGWKLKDSINNFVLYEKK